MAFPAETKGHRALLMCICDYKQKTYCQIITKVYLYTNLIAWVHFEYTIKC